MSVHTNENGRILYDYSSLNDNGDSALVHLLAGPKALWPDVVFRTKTLKRLGLRHIQLTFGTGHYDVVSEEWAESLVGMDMARYVE